MFLGLFHGRFFSIGGSLAYFSMPQSSGRMFLLTWARAVIKFFKLHELFSLILMDANYAVPTIVAFFRRGKFSL